MIVEFKLKSLYICVKDMERAICFYEGLLCQPVTKRDEIYSVFDIGGFRYGLFAYEKMNEPHTYGNNCLPSLEVSDIHLIQKQLEKMNCKIVFPLTKIGDNWVFEFIDSEGNQIEVTSPIENG